jgi:hypothetical protein
MPKSDIEKRTAMHERIQAVSTHENQTAHIMTGVLSVNQATMKAKPRLTAVAERVTEFVG